MSQSDLFKPTARKPGSRHENPFTSRVAASYVAGSVNNLQKLVLGYIINHRGTTDREMVEALRKEHGGSDSTYRTRRSELVELGLVKELGVIRDGRKWHKTWCATEEGLQQ